MFLIGAVLFFWAALAIWNHFDDREKARQAQLDRQAEDFFKPWDQKIANLHLSAHGQSLREEVGKLPVSETWKRSLLDKIDVRVRQLREDEDLAAFRTQSGKSSAFPLKERFLFRLPEKAGVYRIFNMQNGRSYIGESKRIRTRIFKHLEMLNKGKHKKNYGYRPEIQDDFLLNGQDMFGVEVLSTFESDDVRQRHTAEARFISEFDAVNHGYNHKHNQSWTREIFDDAIKCLADGTIDPRRISATIEAASRFKIKKSQQKIIDEKSSNQYRSIVAEQNTELLWTVEKIKIAASAFSTRNEFKLGNPKAYSAARRHNCMDEVCAHMRPSKKKKVKSNKSA